MIVDDLFSFVGDETEESMTSFVSNSRPFVVFCVYELTALLSGYALNMEIYWAIMYICSAYDES